jgi:hypothetical protein
MTTKDAHSGILSDPNVSLGKQILGVAIVDTDTDASAVEIVRHTGSLAAFRAGPSQSHNLMTKAHCASQESTETS